MFEISKPAISWWRKTTNQQHFTPRSVDTTCPHCGQSPITFPFPDWENRGDQLYARSRCPRCNEFARFWLIDPPEQNDEDAINKSRLYLHPDPPLHENLEEGIEETSPMFVKIYNQVLSAEAHSLDELSGMGYRKALEFLIKDYLCQKHPDKADEIRKKLLGPCIQEYVDDPNVKECAKRAAWSGNDETHYVRKWVDKDINDLRMLLRLTRYWISSGYLTNKYKAEMT